MTSDLQQIALKILNLNWNDMDDFTQAIIDHSIDAGSNSRRMSVNLLDWARANAPTTDDDQTPP